MTVEQLMEKFHCRLAEVDGQVAIRISGKATKDQANQLRAAKTEIMERLEILRAGKAAGEKGVLKNEKTSHPEHVHPYGRGYFSPQNNHLVRYQKTGPRK